MKMRLCLEVAREGVGVEELVVRNPEDLGEVACEARGARSREGDARSQQHRHRDQQQQQQQGEAEVRVR